MLNNFDMEFLYNSLNAFTQVSQLNVQLINSIGRTLYQVNNSTQFCTFFKSNCQHNEACKHTRIFSAHQSLLLGEPYIFVCPAELTNISMTINTNKDELYTLIVGPFLISRDTDIILDGLSQKYNINNEEILNNLNSSLHLIPYVSPNMTRHYAFIINCIAYANSSKNIVYIEEQRRKQLQQAEISESIQKYKQFEGLDFTYPYEKEMELIFAVRSGESNKAKVLLNELLGQILVSYGNDLYFIKIRAIELCSILSHTILEITNNVQETLSLSSQFLENLQQCLTLENLCFTIEKITLHFSDNVLNLKQQNYSMPIRKSINYINNNYTSKLYLEQVATHVNLSPVYFSTIFKKETSISFSEYIRKIRIEQSKFLLLHTNNSILNIALSVGYDSDTYFCTIFKKQEGISPSQYRKNH
ncbi:hypothetical protein AN639_08765 [Candidatus Epulonipiscium fishelsonii]|uniref:Uncharacterized protein n=1 Tax=Candidatus Epulonipiscium fishelsonii TaxID=77094 RepID=A0ACC8XFE5_9FIRM|nr:hypothetical protein AN639_08765 [Epulopiscium sp. SCG-B05WGA-EpuloA1]ONI41951.1 hypothetical protein AN396_02625 [Epulopiscium sp. SCG-B11WGA-EpuloA1]